jgi:DNA ligase-1
LEANYIAQPKYDGCNLTVIIYLDGNVLAFSRTGEEVKSVDHIKMALAAMPGIRPGAYLGEAWAPDLEFNEISGLFRRQATTEETCRLQMAIFDYVDLEDYLGGDCVVPYDIRVAWLPENTDLGIVKQGHAPVWLAGSFGKLAETLPGNTAQHVCNKLVESGGYDGLILRDPNGGWRKGSNGTTGEIIKIKRVLSFDLRCVGWDEGKGRNAGRMGNIVCAFEGKYLNVGTGFTDSQREDPDQFVDQIVEIEAMDYSSDGLLREPRFKGIRHDKLEADA